MKDKTNTISNRDRQLLAILVAIVLIFICYYFVAGPAYDQGLILSVDRTAAQTELQATKALLEQRGDLEKQSDARKTELTKKYSTFLYALDDSKLLNQMDGLLTANGLISNSYQQSQEVLEKVELPKSDYTPFQYSLLDTAAKLNPDLIVPMPDGNNNTQAASGTQTVTLDTVEQMDISIGYTGATYEAVYNFIRDLEGLERSFIVKEILIGKDLVAGNLQGQIVVRAISLPKIDETQATDLIFQPVLPQGRTSPF